MPDKTTLLFNTLKSDPLYKDAGLGNSVESFKEYFSDPAKGQQLYNTLSRDPNYKNSGLGSSYNSFANYFGLKKKRFRYSLVDCFTKAKSAFITATRYRVSIKINITIHTTTTSKRTSTKRGKRSKP